MTMKLYEQANAAAGAQGASTESSNQDDDTIDADFTEKKIINFQKKKGSWTQVLLPHLKFKERQKMAKRDYYEVLGLSKGASAAEIKKSLS